MNALPVLVVVTPMAAALVPPLLALKSVRAAKAWTLAAQAACLALAAAALRETMGGAVLRHALGGWPAPWGVECVLDGLSAALAALIAGLAAACSLYAWDWPSERSPVREGCFQSLILLHLAGLLGIVATGDLFNLYVFLEIASLSAYALVAAGPSRAAPLAAFRYLIMGGAGASFWVLGLGYLYASAGTLNMAHLAELWPQLSRAPATAAALGFMAAGLALKMPVFPLHDWQAGAYASAPPQVLPFMAAAGSKAMAYALWRLLAGVLAAEGQAGRVLDALGAAGILSLLAGSLLALTQTDLRRLLAYSSVAQLGLLLIGFSIGGRWAAAGALWHMLAHAAFKACLFMAAGAARRGSSCELSDLAGLSRERPAAAAALAAAGLALIGLPPAAGFFGKWLILRGALDAGAWGAVAAVAASGLLTALYVFRVLEAAYFAPAPAGAPERPPLSALSAAPMLALAAAGVLLGVFSGPIAAAVIEPAWAATSGPGRGG